MIDIGTNGEMVLGNKTRLACCSTAAGPAFEGAKIECGMRGGAGAVDHVVYKDGKWEYTTIGNKAPAGLCGSGLIDLVAQLYLAGFIDESGHLESGQEKAGVFVLVPPEKSGNDRGVYLTQKDIGEVQLAKAAIAAGIFLLMKRHTKNNTAKLQITILSKILLLLSVKSTSCSDFHTFATNALNLFPRDFAVSSPLLPIVLIFSPVASDHGLLF